MVTSRNTPKDQFEYFLKQFVGLATKFKVHRIWPIDKDDKLPTSFDV
jgi:hypothetical protein